jgi:hypothetical protein
MPPLTTPPQSRTAHRLLAATQPFPTGPDVLALQRAVNARRRRRHQSAITEDGIYGPATDAVVRVTAYQLCIGTRRSPAGALSVYTQRLIRSPKRRNARQRARARARMRSLRADVLQPVPIPPDARSEFAMIDGEGAPDSHGDNHHAAFDAHAAGGTPVHAPVSGVIVEVRPSRGNTGQIFGGVVKLQADADERVWVFRHVEPRTTLGHHVVAGELIARVTAWRDGPSHTHIELWKTFAGGYRYENMIDPLPLLLG